MGKRQSSSEFSTEIFKALYLYQTVTTFLGNLFSIFILDMHLIFRKLQFFKSLPFIPNDKRLFLPEKRENLMSLRKVHVTVESRFFKPPRETKNWFKKSGSLRKRE